MMCFENIRIGADVEILRSGFICQGKVRWKGRIPRKNGNWVGVELNQRVGNHSGIYQGIQYFKCMEGYGIFTRATQLRFPASKGRSYNTYKTVSNISFVDESLFARKRGGVSEGGATQSCQQIQIASLYATSAQNISKESSLFNEKKYFPLNHSVGGTLKSTRPFSAAAAGNLFSLKHKDSRKNSSEIIKKHSHQNVLSSFISSPSIPVMRKSLKGPSTCW